MGPSVCCRVQHHPSREHLLPDLLNKLGGLPTEVVVHSSTPPSPWAGYQRCLSALPDGCSHLLIVQDDAAPVPGFAEAVEQIAQTHPHTPVCLYLSSLPRDTRPHPAQALKMGRRYVALSWRSFMPIVAVLWPREKAAEFAEWSVDVRLPGPVPPRSDDAVAGRWKLETRQTVWACVPSIVEHPDQEPSVVRSAINKAAKRTAAFLADDARDYDWSMP